MCRAVECSACGKTTWSGCGQHVEQVMRDVPPAHLLLGQMRGRTLPVAPARFAHQLQAVLAAMAEAAGGPAAAR